MTDQWRSPTNEELVRQQGLRPITSVEELYPGFDLFGSDEEHEAFLAWLYDQRHRCADCTLWPNGLRPQERRADGDVMAESLREGVVPMAEEQQAWRTRREPSPSNEELERRAKPFYSLEQYVTWEDPFESDEEHEAFLLDLYESRREGR